MIASGHAGIEDAAKDALLKDLRWEVKQSEVIDHSRIPTHLRSNPKRQLSIFYPFLIHSIFLWRENHLYVMLPCVMHYQIFALGKPSWRMSSPNISVSSNNGSTQVETLSSVATTLPSLICRWHAKKALNNQILKFFHFFFPLWSPPGLNLLLWFLGSKFTPIVRAGNSPAVLLHHGCGFACACGLPR